jgi:uncharacterized protein YfaS (alpha-2-macroglobulin family)
MVLLFLGNVLFAQAQDTAFKKQWIEIDSLLGISNLPSSALKKVNELYVLAGKTNNPVHQLKALLYRSTIETKVSETDINNKIAALQVLLKSTSDEACQSLIHVFIATQYQQYFNTARWNLYNRSKIATVKKEDILSWGADDFLQAIQEEYQASLMNKNMLKKIKLNKFEVLILKGNTENLRPTLFDLIAHDAINYYQMGQGSRTRPVNDYSIQQSGALGNYKEFSTIKLATSDSNAHAFRALVLFQELIRFHLNDEDKNALIHIDINRINWVAQQSILENKKSLKEQALQSLIDNFNSNEAVFAYLQLARDKVSYAQSYQANTDTANRYKYKEAIQIIAAATEKFSTNNSAKNELENLRQTIIAKNLSSVSEIVNLPNKPFRSLVKYRNVDTLYYRILKLPLEATGYRERTELIIKKLCTTKALTEKKQWLPVTGDYQEHSVEIKIDALPVGEYVLLSSSGKDFDAGKDYLNYHPFQVSNLSFVQNGNDLFVLNRETGMPIKNAEVNIFSNESYSDLLLWYDNGKKMTDENGHIKYEGALKNKVFRFTIHFEKDELRLLGPTTFLYGISEEFDTKTFEKNNRSAYFFTDRSMYRPGQQVFFKSILTTIDKETRQHKLITNEKVVVHLFDANYRLIDSLTVSTNDFGSINGKFILPEKLLTGNFSIQLNDGILGNANFSVEAYKKPTFTIQFEKLKKAYRINDSIAIKGTVKALAGYPINGAAVSYHIIRNVRPIYSYLRYNNFKYSPPQEIAQGQIQTDAQGGFSIAFKALADLSKDSSSHPIFDFSIDVTVTEKSGETRTSKSTLSCGYQSILLQVNHPEIINASNEIKIGVVSTNYNNEKQPSLVHLKLEELNGPQRILKERYWQSPDQFIISQEEYIKDFPFDIYQNENEINQFPIIQTVYETTVDTKINQELIIERDKIKSGYYQITASAKDSLGNLIEYKNYLQVFNPKDISLASGNINFYFSKNAPIEPGEQDTVYAGTNTKELFVIKLIQKQNKPDNYQFLHRKRGISSTIYSIEESDRGGLQIEELIVYQNRVFINRTYKEVPFTNKELNINYSSFRNKTEPGAGEKWTIEITGNKAEKTVAELLTSMYDASLDAFKSQNWYRPNWWMGNIFSNSWTFSNNVGSQYARQYFYDRYISKNDPEIIYDRIASNFIDLWNISFQNHIKNHDKPFAESKYKIPFFTDNLFEGTTLNETVVVGYGAQRKKDIQGSMELRASTAPPTSRETSTSEVSEQNSEPIIRKNFNETAFFFPQLYADSTGKYSFSFTMPEAITKWKWMSFAHTKDLSAGIQSAEIQTQKTLMLQSNAPRFMREGDKMEFSTRIANMSNHELTGQITLELIDATTNTSIDGWFQNIFPTQYFTVGAKQTESVKFPIQIPFSYNKPLIWRVVAKSGNYSDGEENVLAVLSNRTLVTETLPLLVKGDTTQQFHFDKLLHQNSSSLTSESLTVEFSSNPIWYAVQALPYLKQGLDNCAEAVFNNIYANSIAAHIVTKNPIIKTWFEKTKKDTTSLLSNLQKNQQLKQVLLEETPWVLAANTEAERKQKLSELFNLIKLSESNQSSLEKLQELQLPNGAFSWFKGGDADPYITTYILTGIGRLKRLGAITPDMAIRFKPMLLKAVQYTDDKINSEYQWMINHTSNIKSQNIEARQILYLYMRSFYADIALNSVTASNYYIKQSKEYWNRFSVYYQTLIGLIQVRNKEEKFVGKTILPSIFENAVVDKQKGMYWKQPIWDWYSSPIVTGTMVLELASEYNQQNKSTEINQSIDAIKTWLILNKQTNNWETSIKTANACYALLLNGTEWLKPQKTVQIALGKTIIQSTDEKTEAGTGYFEKRIDGSKIDTTMGEIKVITQTIPKNVPKNNQSAWGAIYWQYFEDLDKITEAKSPLSIQKELLVEKITDKGKVLVPADLNNPLKVGDKVVIRMVIKTDRDMEYVHLKDMRAAGMEPVNVMSGYKWQDGMGYYENTTDISSNFFISRLNKGSYVFEYPVYLTHTGNFSVGIANIQCMYAPEFNSHSEGIRINVAE